jgi:hypothetical protein
VSISLADQHVLLVADARRPKRTGLSRTRQVIGCNPTKILPAGEPSLGRPI